MNWFQGEIAEAVAEVKRKQAIFVVFIDGKDEKSTEYSALINGPEIAGLLKSDKFVAIKIDSESVAYQQFSQIYKQVPVPSLYFIGKEGVPLEILVESKNVNIDKLNVILQKAGLTPAAKPSDDLIRNEQAAGTSAAESPLQNVVCENGVCTIENKSEKKQEEVAEDQPSVDEKVERAKQIIERKRIEKQKEEEEKEKQKEIERRKTGQSVQQLKRWQDEQELKNVLEERKKEKMETQAARERVLAQIAQDKAERATRFGNAAPPAPAQHQQPSTSTPRPVNMNTARLQFRMPDGSTAVNDFGSSDNLGAVHDYIRSHLKLPFTNYTLSTTFPRREFTEGDKMQSLLELGLAPTAVILILPLNRGTISTNSNPSGGLTGMLWSLLTPIFTIFDYLRTFIFGSSANNQQDHKDDSRNDNNKRTHESREAENKLMHKMRRGETTVVKRQGNVHRLARNDSDDENNTWNGNSTQQM